MPVERKTPCQFCYKPTETLVRNGLQIQHGDCWENELQRRLYHAKDGSVEQSAIMETLSAIATSKQKSVD